ncbi:hypothetical protein FEZ63_12210 [Microvirga brassicacearum]|uniref:Uncharacterized protein n=1 Tax=Microvirga brassicacearum TaxID=2580413 RepID=A0A5N3PAS2_9HYPH|nr:hypothetical protein FEZ63_12210 [Microvirga brassicacearum]
MKIRLTSSGMVWLGVVAGLLVLAFTNAHLVYIAFSSEPGCVPHTKQIGTVNGVGAPFRAAKSAC